jgi:uroporphyrinogen-III decarboxylase
MNIESPGWLDPDAGENALWSVLNGREAPIVPVAPLFVDSPFRTVVDERLCRSWAREIERSGGGDTVEVDFETYARLRFELMCEIIDRYNTPPCWVRMPWTAFRGEVEGCRVARREEQLVWIDRDGAETGLMEKLRDLDRRPGPWPMDQPVDRTLDEVRELLDKDPQSLIPAESLGDPGSRWESASERDLRSEGCLTVWDWIRERYRGAMPAYVMGMCPTALLQDVVGFDSTMVGFLQAPDIIHEVSRLGMPRNRAHWQAIHDAGVEMVHVSEYTWGGQISPEVYGEFIVPYTRELIEFYRDIGFKVLLYVMGDIHGVLDQIAAYPFDALAIEEGRKDYDLDVGVIREGLGDDRALFGNVPCLLVEEGRPEDVLGEVRRQIAAEGQSGRFVVSIGEPLPQGTPPERVRFFCDSTRLISGG